MLLKSIYSIDNPNTRSSQFYIKTEKGAREQDSGETKREQGRESKCGLRKDEAFIGHKTEKLENKHMLIK